jgi:hypothetical protein
LVIQQRNDEFVQGMVGVNDAHVSVKEKGKLDGWICGKELGKDAMATE